jgi:hypothetical protein
MKRALILPELRGGLWHTTHPDRFKSILASGAILPEPNIPDGERYCTGGGKEHYPYVRMLGGVSLFDFAQFEPDQYEKRCPSSSWAYFVQHHLHWERAVWIEMDREHVADKFVSGTDLLSRWKSEGAYGHNINAGNRGSVLGWSSASGIQASVSCSQRG